MDILLLVIAIILMLAGIVGCVAPVLPGPPLTWAGLLLVKFTRFGDQLTWTWLLIWAGITIVVTVLDYLIPIWGTKKMGGSKKGVWGATIGMIAGIFFLPWGIIFGPFIGALVGELITGKEGKASLKAAFGSFWGFLSSIGLKLLACGLMVGYFVINAF